MIKLTSGCWVQRKVNGTGLHGPQKAKLLQMSPSQATYMPLRTLLLFETLLPPWLDLKESTTLLRQFKNFLLYDTLKSGNVIFIKSSYYEVS